MQISTLKFLFLVTFLCLATIAFSQNNRLSDIVRDTIVRIDKGIFKPYVLDGKPIPNEVMKWFMQDYPETKANIQGTIITYNFAAASYSLGASWIVIDLLTHEFTNSNWEFLKAGSVMVGIGIGFQIISSQFKKKAVRDYNRGVQQTYQNENLGLHLNDNGAGIHWSF